MNQDDFIRFVTSLVDVTGPTIMSVYRSPALEVSWKGDQSPVTWADTRAEELMRDTIHKRWPDHGIIGEEYGEDRPDAEWVWVLDPIDGTRAFTAGCPLFGTLIGVLHRDEPRFGAIHLPALGDLYLGDGTVSTRNGTPIRTRPSESLAESTLLCTDTLSAAEHQDGPAFDRLLHSVRQVRTWGDCFGYTLVAGGGADLMLDPVMNRWDLAALIPVLRGAGGVITDWQGGDPARGDSAIAAASTELHAEVIAALQP